MKKYRLKQWYPSLDEEWDTTHRYEYQSSTGYMRNMSMQHCVIIYKKELHSDFWELIEEKEPLFTTDDGVEVSNPEDWIYLVNPLFEKIERYARNSNITISKEIVKVFYFEANADDYIWKNKPIFSYNDIKKLQSGGEGVFYDVKAIAKERSKK